jgi:hypothetical protein
VNLTVLTQVTPDDPLALTLAGVAFAIIAVALVVTNHNLKDRF